jgi:protein SCO1/2
MLDGGGSYLTQISVGEGAALQVLSFPIRVAPWYRPLMVPALLIFAVVAFIALSAIRYYWTPAHDDSSLGLPNGKAPRSLASLPRSSRPSGSTLPSSIVLFPLISCLLSLAACDRERGRHEASLPDVQVIDDHGNPLALRSLRGKIVLLDFIHVGCPGVCSNLVNKFGQVADRLGPELGSRVILLSVTNDPIHDNPTELLKLARSSQADMKGWLFVTGNPDDVNRVIKEFGLNNDRLPDGSPNHLTAVFLLGSDGRQKRQYRGMVMNSDAVATQVKNMLERE